MWTRVPVSPRPGGAGHERQVLAEELAAVDDDEAEHPGVEVGHSVGIVYEDAEMGEPGARDGRHLPLLSLFLSLAILVSHCCTLGPRVVVVARLRAELTC